MSTKIINERIGRSDRRKNQHIDGKSHCVTCGIIIPAIKRYVDVGKIHVERATSIISTAQCDRCWSGKTTLHYCYNCQFPISKHAYQRFEGECRYCYYKFRSSEENFLKSYLID